METLRTIRSWDEVPAFESEKAEMEFWQNHQLDVRLMKSAIFSPDQTESTTITLRVDPRLLSKIKRLARARYLNYQSMIKQWIVERLEKEV